MAEIVADGRFVYGDVPREGAGAPFNIVRMRPNGHGLFNIAKGGGSSRAVDDTYIYFLDATQTKLMRTCKLSGL